MEGTIFKISRKQLIEIANELSDKIDKGLKENDQEIRCLPTYINPSSDNLSTEKVLVLDLGGTNFRAAVVQLNERGELDIIEQRKEELAEIMKRTSSPINREQFFKKLSEMIGELNIEGIKKIGYCFSYPCENYENGDAKLIEWTKGVTNTGMVGELVGKQLMEYLNRELSGAAFEEIKVINDTIAALYGGIKEKADAYIGLIVGTGTNMAAIYPASGVEKVPYSKGNIAINLESGNFSPNYATEADRMADSQSDHPGKQRFEKMISGMYLGKLLEYTYPYVNFGKDLDAEGLTLIMSYPDTHKKEIVKTAEWIYERSAKLVAASLVGFILNLSKSKAIKTVCLIAEGGLFWSNDSQEEGIRIFKSYKDIVEEELNALLKEPALKDKIGKDIKVTIKNIKNANLTGSAVAAISPAFKKEI